MNASTNQQKYESTNPILQRLIERFHQRIVEVVRPLEPKTILDAGCGEGYLSRVLLDHLPGVEVVGVDLSEGAVAQARARCPEGTFQVGTVESLRDLGRSFDLVVCSEVLEHVDDPRSVVGTLAGLAAPHALLTVPWEPWFQLANFARGKYLSTLGNHPEHIHRWSKRAFVQLTSTAFEPLHAEAMFPWTLLLGKTRTTS